MKLTLLERLKMTLASTKLQEQSEPCQYDIEVGWGWRSVIWAQMKESGVECLRCLNPVRNDGDIRSGLARLEVWYGYGKEALLELECELARTMEDVCQTQGWLLDSDGNSPCRNPARFVVRDHEQKHMFSFCLPRCHAEPPNPKRLRCAKMGCTNNS